MNMPGFYRGTVIDVEDPETRGRYRVRIHHIHDDDVPVDHIPWAEMCTVFSAKDANDIPHYEVGDLVWCAFEGGDTRYPVLCGGWVSQVGGLPDMPPEQSGDYSEGRKRWRRQDRRGNYIEVSEVGREMWVKMGSGRSSITVSQRGESIQIEADGPVTLRGSNIRMYGEQISMSAGDIASAAGGLLSVNRLLSSNQLIIGISNSGVPFGFVDIGQYVDDLGIPKQTLEMNIEPQVLNIGNDGLGTRLPTTLINVGCAGPISIKSQAGGISIGVVTGPIDIETDAGDITVKTLAGNVTATTEAGNAELSTKLGNVKASTELGNAELSTLAGQAKVETQAGQVSVKTLAGDCEVDSVGGIVRVGTSASQVIVG